MKESKPNEDLNRIPSGTSKILARTFIILMASVPSNGLTDSCHVIKN